MIKKRNVMILSCWSMVGAVVGYLIVHPVTMVLYMYEHRGAADSLPSIIEQVMIRTFSSFTPPMLYMAAFLVGLSALLGLAAGVFHLSSIRKNIAIEKLTRELTQNVESLIQSGESASVEFKAAMRWDVNAGMVNQNIEQAIIKTICGFMNTRGGTLLMGVNDNGEVVGLKHDYVTLKRKNRDGFEQKLMEHISKHLGSDRCHAVHVLFRQIGEEDVCRAYVEQSPRPVYFESGKDLRFFVRTGNASRELNVREATNHISSHWPHLSV